MDPNANLKEQREIYLRVLGGKLDTDDLDRLAELSCALDAWLKAGGFLPEDWKARGR